MLAAKSLFEKYMTMGCGDSSLRKVLALQAWGPEFRSLGSLGKKWCAGASNGEVETGESRASVATQHSFLGKFYLSKIPGLNKKVDGS